MRLIDADLLTDGKGVFSKFIKFSDDFVAYIEIQDLLKVLENASTAFDTEKVIEQIHDKYCHKCRNILGKQSSEEYCKSVKCEIDSLCDIVKKGGVE